MNILARKSPPQRIYTNYTCLNSFFFFGFVISLKGLHRRLLCSFVKPFFLGELVLNAAICLRMVLCTILHKSSISLHLKSFLHFVRDLGRNFFFCWMHQFARMLLQTISTEIFSAHVSQMRPNVGLSFKLKAFLL